MKPLLIFIIAAYGLNAMEKAELVPLFNNLQKKSFLLCQPSPKLHTSIDMSTFDKKTIIDLSLPPEMWHRVMSFIPRYTQPWLYLARYFGLKDEDKNRFALRIEQRSLCTSANIDMLEKKMLNRGSLTASKIPQLHHELKKRWEKMNDDLTIDSLRVALSECDLESLQSLLRYQLINLRSIAPYIPSNMPILERRLYLLPCQLPAHLPIDEQFDHRGFSDFNCYARTIINPALSSHLKQLPALHHKQICFEFRKMVLSLADLEARATKKLILFSIANGSLALLYPGVVAATIAYHPYLTPHALQAFMYAHLATLAFMLVFFMFRSITKGRMVGVYHNALSMYQEISHYRSALEKLLAEQKSLIVLDD